MTHEWGLGLFFNTQSGPEMIDPPHHCMPIQCFTAERLREKGRHWMAPSLTELEELIETLDLTRQEEDRFARILEKLRDETTAS